MGFTLICILMLSIFTVVCSAENSMTGEGGIVIFKPIGNVIVEWGPGSGSGYTEVDDDVPDETGTYVGTSVNGKTDVYSITPQTILGINNVTVFGRFITDFIGSKFLLLLYENPTSSFSYSPSIQLSKTGSWQTISYTWEMNPFTGLVWNESDIYSLSIGICAEYCESYGAVFCTQVYAEVEYSTSDPPNDNGDDEDPPEDDDTNPPEEDEPTIEKLIEQVMLLNLSKRFEKRLINKLKNAIRFLNKNKLKAVINKLESFIKIINRFQKKDKITETEASNLINLANQIVEDFNEDLNNSKKKFRYTHKVKYATKNYSKCSEKE